MRAMRCVWQSIRPGRTVARPSSMTFVFLGRSEEHTSELQSRLHLVCRLLLEKKKINLIATLHGEISGFKGHTPYVKHGDILALGLALVLLAVEAAFSAKGEADRSQETCGSSA